MGGVDPKGQLLHMYLVKRKKIIKQYLKLFKRLLNSTALNSMMVYRNSQKNTDHLSYRVQVVEGLFMKYGSASEECAWTTFNKQYCA
jgi:hypothetical protein